MKAVPLAPWEQDYPTRFEFYMTLVPRMFGIGQPSLVTISVLFALYSATVK